MASKSLSKSELRILDEWSRVRNRSKLLYENSSSPYDENVAMIYDYGVKKKLVLCRTLRRKGFEDEDVIVRDRGTVNSAKLDESISRTRSTIFELAYCNPWEYFITLTISPERYDRSDLKAYKKDLTQWLRDYSKKHGISVKYLFIPEMHQDGNWHMHGFIMGLPEDHLKINEHGYLDWMPYRTKFGWISLDKVRNQEAAAKYITKYVSKDLAKSVTDLNARMFYASQGLARKVLIKKGTLAATSIPFDFSNDYVAVKWFSSDFDHKNLVD